MLAEPKMSVPLPLVGKTAHGPLSFYSWVKSDGRPVWLVPFSCRGALWLMGKVSDLAATAMARHCNPCLVEFNCT